MIYLSFPGYPNFLKIFRLQYFYHPFREFVFRLCIYDRKSKDGADINRALVYFKRTPPTVHFSHYLI